MTRINQKTYDVCVIGSGASGGIVALELARRGASVVILEAGKWIDPTKDFYSHTMPYELPLRGRGTDFFKGMRVDPRREPFTTAGTARSDHLLIKAVGGKSLLWAGLSWRISPYDMKEWPIRYEDLAPYYDKVERLIGVTGNYDRHPNVPDGVFLKPLRWNCGTYVIRKAIERLDPARYRLITARKAILTERHVSGRAPCHYCGYCMRGCDSESKYTSANTAVPLALKTGKCDLIINANAARVIYDRKSARVTGVSYYDARTLNENEVRAKYVVLACGPIESTRLLLNSKTEQYPEGLANSSGLLGKNLMSHTMNFVSGLLKPLQGAPVINDDGTQSGHAYIPSFYWERPHPDFPSAYHIVIETGAQKGIGNPGFAMRLPGFGSDLKRSAREIFPALGGLMTQNGMIPAPGRFVTLDPKVKDVYGLPVPKIHFEYTSEDWALHRDAKARITEIFEAAGGEVWHASDNMGHDSTHYVGTAKMGTDPKRSVLTTFCRTHDIENLYIADGSCFVDYAEKNPTLTVMALAARTSDYIYEQLRQG